MLIIYKCQKDLTLSGMGGERMGCNIKNRREELRMTQDELAKKSGVSRQTISSIEKNAGRNTSTKTLQRIANALGSTVSELFFNEAV